jgi:hypothetical protein
MRWSFALACGLVIACGSPRSDAPGPTSPPTTGSQVCQTDADCELVNGQPPSCCSRCTATAMSKPDAERVRAECAKSRSGDYFDRCPHLSCTCVQETARCTNGACTVESADC